MRRPRPATSRFGLLLALGALLLTAAGLFSAIAAGLASGDRLAGLDIRIADRLHAEASPALIGAMRLVSDLNSTMAIGAYAAAISLVQAMRRRWRDVLVLIACIDGGLLLNVAMKLVFHRARPVFDDPILTLATYSFPSGHVVGATLFYGLGVVWAFGRTTRSRWRVSALLGMSLAIGLVALSRMVLGVHYLSDVVAAAAEGAAWLAFVLLALVAMRCETAVASAAR
jgi:undecaprenyl-diphosphatase